MIQMKTTLKELYDLVAIIWVSFVRNAMAVVQLEVSEMLCDHICPGWLCLSL